MKEQVDVVTDVPELHRILIVYLHEEALGRTDSKRVLEPTLGRDE
jgi:hypothetical protein